MENIGKILGGVAIASVIGFAIFGNNSSSSPSYGRFDEYEDSSANDNYENLEDLAYDHWDEVREYMSGTETIEACSDSGCYSLDAEIFSGNIDTVYFPNGGYISPDAEIGSDGLASGYSSDGEDWSFEVSVDSSTIQDAIFDWASEYRSSRDDYLENNSRF